MAPNPLGLRMTRGVRVAGLVRRLAGRDVLAGLDLDIRDGEFVALLGRSGSGKSTLLRALAALDHGVSGTGTLQVPDHIAMIFQDARLLPWKRVLENIVYGLAGRDAEQRARQALEEVELAGRERAWPHELSGGEQQRVALARALVREPALLLADEPFGALDALTRLRMHALLHRLCAVHRPTVLLVTHDVDEAIKLADRVLLLDDGKITVDIATNLTGNAEHRVQQFTETRSLLLRELGVPADILSVA